MIYIALAFLEGILLIYNKPLAYTLAGLLFLMLYKRKLPILLTILILCQPIISYEIFSSHIKSNIQDLKWFKIHSHLNNRIEITQLKVKNEKYVEGIAKLQNHSVKLFYFPKQKSHLIELKKLPSNLNCIVEGQLKVDSDFNDTISLMVNKFNTKSCTAIESNSVHSIIEKHKAFSLTRLKLNSPYWQNTYAMITGDVSYIDKGAIELDKEIGIFHLLAVSSSHVVVIASIFYFVFNRFSIPLFITKTFIIFVLFLFAYYTNFAPSALRAILCMSLVMIIPKRFYQSLLDILATVFLFLCVTNPDIVFDIGFQFSFLITFFIMLCAPILKTLTTIQSMYAMTFIAQIGSFLVSAFHFNQIQWIGFVANFIFIPFYSFILFPIAILTFFYYQFFGSNLLLNQIISFSYWLHDTLLIPIFKHLTCYRWFIGEMNSLLLAGTLIWLVLMLTLTTNGKIKKSTVIFILGSIIITYSASLPHLRFTALNVGQGDSFLFETGARQRILIDTGGKAQNENELFDFSTKNANASHSISKFHVLPTLRKRGISSLDYVIITHPHADHIGELDYIISHVHIKRLIINFKSYPTHTLMQLKDLCHKYKTTLLDVNSISSIKLGDNKIKFYNTAITQSKDLNDHSIIALIQTKTYNILTTGDATIKNEQKLLSNYKLPKIDILKVGHHGSKTSNSEVYLNTIHPTYSIISSGQNNVYKLPNKSVVDRLKKVGTKLYNTQNNGEVTFKLNKEIEVETEK
ncbi:DNA internalization-related competence protein ComEC/Rec2 [Staphylococcus sp. HMSC061G12]|uniref:DNA internalization-related competence protein ComEC/Rec2 n=1 Tax=Staphylococcus sp. HMSC061G12 TaxID=1739441 RepID=UPI0008AA4B4B|nr:DNA internalization-related competence protein ComEC/Rec2 [Staphylococcus sp. HMSC061G12]OHR61176.1 DNA internalization-related competence protein ComEC/Rec2 [Staphylococcus sp. HMSC061G12]